MLRKAAAQNGFFHLGQIIGESGPSWTMSVFQREVDDIVAIVDATTSGDQENICDSMSLKSFMSGMLAACRYLGVEGGGYAADLAFRGKQPLWPSRYP